MSKPWFILYYVWHEGRQRWTRKRLRTAAMRSLSVLTRRAEADRLVQIVERLLAEGYVPQEAVPDWLDLPLPTVMSRIADEKQVEGRTGKWYRTLAGRIERHESVVLRELSLDWARRFMAHLHAEGLSTKTRNTYRNTLSTALEYLIRTHDVRISNPMRRIPQLRVVSSQQHRPYTEAQRAVIGAWLSERGYGQTLLFVQFIYYTFARSGSELRLLRVGDLRPDTIYIPAERAKTGQGAHVAIARPLADLIARHHLRSYPPHYYVFGPTGPGLVPVGVNHHYRRHAEALAALGLVGQGYTLYSWKHSGAIALYQVTRNIEVVRRHCRHTHAAMTAEYLRDYGLITDAGIDDFPTF